ncbi:MAG: hypothetical protein J5J06_00460 [Phycisphaerae bacterium]|nr:hypothetical protein [Phycisphaerae bacterium]
MQRPRIYWLNVPAPSMGLPMLFVLACGTIVCWTIAVIVIIFLTNAIWPDLEPSSYFLVCMCILALIGPVAWFWTVLRARQALARRRSQLRLRRLHTLLESGSPRFLHRRIELRLRGDEPRNRKRERILRNMPHGTVVVIYDRRSRPDVRPQPTSFFFEPTSLLLQNEDAMRLAELMRERQAPDNANASTAFRASDAFRRWMASRNDLTVRLLAAIALWSFCLVWFARAAGGLGVLAAGTLIGVLLLIPFSRIRYAFAVPGGVAVRDRRLWSQKSRLHIFTADSSQLYVDLRTGTVVPARDGSTMPFRCDPRCAWVLLAAWISRARRPGIEELRVFFGPDAELKATGNGQQATTK